MFDILELECWIKERVSKWLEIELDYKLGEKIHEYFLTSPEITIQINEKLKKDIDMMILRKHKEEAKEAAYLFLKEIKNIDIFNDLTRKISNLQRNQDALYHEIQNLKSSNEGVSSDI